MSQKVSPPADHYWKANLRITFTLLFFWAIIGLGGGVLAADWLNQFTLPGTHYPLGFWFAHQGAIVAFVVIILIYALLLNRLDKKHKAHLDSVSSDNDTVTEDPS